MRMYTCRVVLVLALTVAPAPVLAVDGVTLTSQQEGAESGEGPASTDVVESLAGVESQQEVVRVVETSSITETVALTEIVPVAETVLVTEVVLVTETVFITEVVTVEQIVPVTETVFITEFVTEFITEVVTVEQIVPVTETVFITEVVTVEQIVPVTETVFITEFIPVTETVFITEFITEVVTVEQIVPVTETVFITEAIAIESADAPDDVEDESVSQELLFQPVEPEDSLLPTVTSSKEMTSAPTAAIITPAPLNEAPGAAQKLTHWTQLAPPYSEPTPLPLSGLAMYYAPNVMEGVALYRERVNNIEECEECVGQVALLRAGDIGRYVWIQVGEGVVEGPFQVLDVAGRHHIPDLLRRNWVVDVDYETAMRWGMRGPIEVTIYAEPQEKLAMRSSKNDDSVLR